MSNLKHVELVGGEIAQHYKNGARDSRWVRNGLPAMRKNMKPRELGDSAAAAIEAELRRKLRESQTR